MATIVEQLTPILYSIMRQKMAMVLYWSNFLHLHQQIKGGTVKSLRVEDLMKAFREVIEELGKMFPIFPEYAEEIACEFESGERSIEDGLPGLGDFVCYQGFDTEQGFDDLHELEKLIIALGIGEDWIRETVIKEEWRKWWGEMAEQRGWPGLEEIDPVEVEMNIEGLPEPWIGLAALQRWINGGTGNVFVDVPALYGYELGAEYGWTIEDIYELEEEYGWAEYQIFGPAKFLMEMTSDRNSKAFLMCVELSLGLKKGWVQDGELILLDVDEGVDYGEE